MNGFLYTLNLSVALYFNFNLKSNKTFRYAFDDLLKKSKETVEEKKGNDSSTSETTKLILSCSFLKGYWEKNKEAYEGYSISGI